MTREEAIKELEKEGCYECTWGCESPVKCTCPKCNLIDALKMAIEALKEQRPRGDIEELKELLCEIKEEKDDIDLNKVSAEKLSWYAGFKSGMARALLILTHFVNEKRGEKE